MVSFAFYAVAAVLLAQSTVAFNCSKPPVYVDIHKRAVHESSEFQYGSFIGVGTKAQNHSLWPSLSHNHTSFAARGLCNDNNSSITNCLDSTGGFFVREDSTSFKEDGAFKSLDNTNGTFKETIFGRDTIRLYTHYFETDGASQTLLEDSIVEVVGQASVLPGIVGVGASSTVLESLVANDIIAGRTYSLYIGQGFDRAGGAVNGSNTFGGYDAGRFKGPAHQYQMNLANPNPMSVRVKDIYISDPTKSGVDVSLFDTAAFPEMKSKPASFEAQLTTDQYPLSLPYEITQNFIKYLDAVKDNYWGDNSLKLKSNFTGTLSIVLDDGFVVTIPSEVLVNNTLITPIQDREKESNAPFYLSTAFLGQVYLMADYESYNFYLAEAVQKNNMVMPQTFCPKSVPAAYERPKQSEWMSKGLIGAVIGGIIGGMGIAITAYCFWLAFVRKRAEKKAKEAELELEKGQKSKMAQMEIEEAPEFDPPPRSAKPLLWRKK